MKKYVLLLIIILIISGCTHKKETSIDANFNVETYKIFEPYKESISGNYINYMVNNNYDANDIQSRLMELTTKYFKTTNYYYQAGQYLDITKIKEILSKLNPSGTINIDGIDIKPNYISYIHEQNYLDKDGNLAGISMGVALNKYQSYQNSYGATLYKEIEEEVLTDYAKEQVSILLNYLREIEALKDTKIIVGLYFSSSPNSILPGSYKYLGITSNNDISFEKVNYNYYYLDSNELMEKNADIYNDFKAFKKQIDINNIYISGYGLFYENNLVSATINIVCNYLTRDELIYLEQTISKTLNNSFKLKSLINVHIKVNNKVIGMVIKDNNNQILNYILE